MNGTGYTFWRAKQSAGFTLLELMVTVGIAAILLGIAIPSMQNFMLSNRMTGAANDILAAVYAARTEAAKRNVQAVICFTSTPDAAMPKCDGNAKQGWIVFIDDANSDPTVVAATDNNGIVNANEDVVLRHDALDAAFTTHSTPADNKGYLAFGPSGISREIGGLGEDIEGLVLCDKRGNTAVSANSAARGVEISQMGRPRIVRSIVEITKLGGCP
jgi:type IV fimbrial biogenesis protein FimT